MRNITRVECFDHYLLVEWKVRNAKKWFEIVKDVLKSKSKVMDCFKKLGGSFITIPQ